MNVESALIKRTSALNKQLRSNFYSKISNANSSYDFPPDIYKNDPLGSFPEVNLFSNYCLRSKMGFCSPCFYSRISPQVNYSNFKRKNRLLTQLQNSIDYLFDSATYISQKNKSLLAGLGLAGSFFSNYESSRQIRSSMLEIIDNKCIKQGVKFKLILESHALDIISAYNSGELLQINKDFLNIDFVHTIGLESKNDYYRNVLYNKGLTLNQFENAIDMIHQVYSSSAAFIYIGLPTLGIKQIIDDCNENIKYLIDLKTIPLLMFSHLQPFNLLHLFYSIKEYTLPDPWCVVDCINSLKAIKINKGKINWLISIEGGPPPPILDIFTNSQTIACPRCKHIIHEMILNLRKEYNWGKWDYRLNTIISCECYNEYLMIKNIKTNNNYLINYDTLLSNAELKLNTYINSILPE